MSSYGWLTQFVLKRVGNTHSQFLENLPVEQCALVKINRYKRQLDDKQRDQAQPASIGGARRMMLPQATCADTIDNDSPAGNQ